MSKFTETEKVKILKDLVSIQSVNDNEIEVCNYLKDLLSKHGIDSKIIKISDSRANLVTEIGESGPVLGISGHMDVVSAGDLTKWTYDPFTLTEKDGKLYGRGSADMKSGLAALVLSLIDIHDQSLLTNGRIRLLATAGEEIVGEGAKAFQEQGYMKDVDALVIAEPSQDRIIYAHKGSMDIRVISRGKASHSSMPQLGFNAISPLVKFVYKADEGFKKFDQHNDLLGNALMNATIFNGGNQVNSIPEHAESEFNIRTIPEHDNNQFISYFNDILKQVETDKTDIEIDTYMSRPPVYTTGQNKLATLAHDMGTKYLKKDLPFEASPGVTDASDLLVDKDENFSFIMYGPGLVSQAHQVDEYVEKSSYLTFIDLYTELFPTYLKHL
ncbi:ArgE/DapE family deacylase [Staphylococcus caeli]|uniref:Probable succinyl-diaminopimelate desuccinylase n=1 Tax=Staphylococcus caeli TaxID=2201815 RepID=A0A1D4J5G0_9STAP|nr:ArgE/DapE family deacylase [Staphylococcus caeli]SCS38694.1 succinyl-diaminopimelate desuccinylase [Staphylococcus caeli]SCS56954.1 succinyl-diaminopimelate desuccinylase [Staphylococcus caeli]